MATGVHDICTNAVIQPTGTDVAFCVRPRDFPIPTFSYGQVKVLLNLTEYGAGYGPYGGGYGYGSYATGYSYYGYLHTTMVLYLQVSHDNVNWSDVTIHDLSEVPPDPLTSLPDAVAANKWIQAQAIVLTTDTDAMVIGLSNPAPYVRLVVRNTGSWYATLTAWFYFNN